MKHQFFLGFLFACLCSGFTSLAQNPLFKEKRAERSMLFANLPLKSPCNGRELEKILQHRKSDLISLKLADNLELSGEIIEQVETSPGIQNLNVRLSNFGNAILNISVFTQPDNTKKIVGRIIHPMNADALVISEENGKYFITKHKMEFFMVE